MKKNNNRKLSGRNSSTWGGKILPALCNIAGTLIIIGVILTLIPAAVPSLFGYEVYNITSGSMAPAIPVGSAVYVKPVEPASVQDGEIIAFQSGDTVIVHRVSSNHVVEGEFVTKGDANAQEDFETVPYEAFIGRVDRHFPYLGGILAMNTSRLGKLYLMLYLVCGVLLNIVAARMRSLS